MIAAAAAAPPVSNGMPFNWFDLAVLIVLVFGLVRGRRNGMAKELLPSLQWIVMVLLCGLCYPILAGALSGLLPDPLWNCLAAYLALALVVFIVFAVLKRQLAEKLVKSDFFKSGEYYLGMLAGLVRFGCVLLFVLALLNAPVFTPMQIAAQRARDQQNFGGGAGSGFAGNYFPHLSTVQSSVFKDSLLGPRIRDDLGMLLINTDQPGVGGAQQSKPKPVIKIGN
jgi:uncharacterized membrane protein required for colicin V production